MVILDKIKAFIKEYKLTKFIVMAITLYIGYDFLTSYIYYNCLDMSDRTYESTCKTIAIAAIALWGYLLFYNVRNISYQKLTGRKSYKADHDKFNRTFFSLTEYYKTADTHKLDIKKFPISNWYDANGIMLGSKNGHLIKLNSTAEANIAVFGAPGSRKTSGIAIPSASKFSGSVVAIDIKGDIYNYNKGKRKIIRFCPDIKNSLKYSAHFDPFAGLRNGTETERKLFLDNMALILIPDDGGEDSTFFSSRAQKLFKGITAYLLEQNPDLTFPEVLDVILHPSSDNELPQNVFDWVKCIIASDCNDAKEQVSSMYGNNEKNISGAYDALCTALIPFSNNVLNILLDGKGKCINMKMINSGYDCYLQIRQENLKVYAPLFTLIIQSLMTSFMGRPDSSSGEKNRPILMLLDELPQLNFSFDQLNAAISTLRSKSVICMLICQTMAQLQKKYGSEGCRALLGCCQYMTILNCIDGESQQYFSKLIGTRKALKISNSTSQSTQTSSSQSTQEVREPIFQPEDFGDLKEQLVIYYNGKYTLANKINCYDYKGE